MAILASFLGSRILTSLLGRFQGARSTGSRGQVGYLVPVDGKSAALSTLVRWDDLTRNADLVPAKHILFLIDACYGGLAVTRALPPGSSRFLREMLRRPVRQAIAAGKADEVVSDAGGPRAGHSLFTGHLLDALDGSARSPDGILSANALMAYVYDRVAKDRDSRQSPHYGFVDGDGDFIFSYPEHSDDPQGPTGADSLIVEIPSTFAAPEDLSGETELSSRVKEYIAENRFRIHLDDLVTKGIRSVLRAIGPDEFPLNDTRVSAERISARLRGYEEALEQLALMMIQISKWGKQEHIATLEKIVLRVRDGSDEHSGVIAWLGLQRYPLMYLLYAGGISALSSHNYQNLATLLLTRVHSSSSEHGSAEVVLDLGQSIVEMERTGPFKSVPGYERFHCPRSEYLFKTLQPPLEDSLFLGRSYEDLFDRFEIFLALTHADLFLQSGKECWGPVGRFGWKDRSRIDGSPFKALFTEAERRGQSWPPLGVGLFGGKFQRFHEAATGYRDEVLSKLNWH